MANAQANVVATSYIVETLHSTGTITFGANPTAADTITLNGVEFTYVASGATGNQINIGTDLAETLRNTASVLNSSSLSKVSAAYYTYDTTTLTITHVQPGILGNSFTLAASVATVSGGTLTGGNNAGTTPGGNWKYLRANNPDFNGNISTTTSQELRSDRNITDLVRTSGSSEGSIGFEMSAEEYDSFMESSLGGKFSKLVNISSTAITALAADNSINGPAGTFNTADILPGHFLKISGFANSANNGFAQVVSLSDQKIVFDSRLTLVDETTGSPTVTVKGKSLRNGAVKTAFSLQREFTDLAPEFMSHVGMLVSGWTLNTASEAIVDGSFSFVGRETTTVEIGTGYQAATANPIMSGVANVGTIYEGGSPLSGVFFKSINMTTNNNTRNLTAIGNLYPIDINMGSFNVEFAIEAYFSDTSLFSKYLNGTSTKLSYNLVDDDGNLLVIDAPKTKYSSGSLTGVSLNSDVMQSLTATGLYDPVQGYALQISYLPA